MDPRCPRSASEGGLRIMLPRCWLASSVSRNHIGNRCNLSIVPARQQHLKVVVCSLETLQSGLCGRKNLRLSVSKLLGARVSVSQIGRESTLVLVRQGSCAPQRQHQHQNAGHPSKCLCLDATYTSPRGEACEDAAGSA